MNEQSLDFYVGNLDCESDAGRLKGKLVDVPGVVAVTVFPKAARVSLRIDGDKLPPETLEQLLEEAGFPPRPRGGEAKAPKPWSDPKVLTSLASGVLLVGGWIAGTVGVAEAGLAFVYYAAMGVGGYYFGREALFDLLMERKVGIELLMAVAALSAAALGLPAEGAMLVFLYSISEAAEGYTAQKTRSAIKALMALAPKTALLLRDGRQIEVPAEELAVGDVFLVKPGQSVATDGIVAKGTSTVNQAPVTGESVPVEKEVGDPVFAATINGEGALEVSVTQTSATNTISRIIQMVEEAQERKGNSQRFIERFGARYSPAVLVAGVGIAVSPPLLFDAAWAEWLVRATVFVVAAAPCALVISIPITMVATLGTAARNGVLAKGGIHIEDLARIDTVCLDKTGTLTRGEPEVTNILLWEDRSDDGPTTEDELLETAAAIERLSQHPIAHAVVRRAQEKGLTSPPAEEFQSLTGAGASAVVEGRKVYIGSPALYEKTLRLSIERMRAQIEVLQAEGKTVIVIGDQRCIWGLIAVRDNLRPEARRAIRGLHEVGVSRVVMLTGDNERTALAIARELGIDVVYSDLKPEDKVARVKELAATGHVAMVGDGVNDAPALAEATVGVAMGAAGTDVALETADVALMGDDLEKLVYALGLAKRTRRVVRQNLVLSVLVVGVLVIGALAGVFTLPVAVLAHEISEFIVIGSGLRMLRA